MARLDANIRFWLRYVESTGGTWEHDSDRLLVLLPETLTTAYDLPEEQHVTADPEVAREDHVTLLAPGHPLLNQASEKILTEGDIGQLQLQRPSGSAPNADQLLAAARDEFPVDHGRIDATGTPTTGLRPVARVGALVTYQLSTSDLHQEQTECWVDVGSRLAIPEPVIDRLRRGDREPPAEDAATVPGSTRLTQALAYAHERLETQARSRRSALSVSARQDFRREHQRTTDYYDQALATLRQRIAAAPADRVGALQARAENMVAERARRIAEVEEKHQPQHSIHPFRLHLLHVPVLRLPVDIRRGDRRYPLTLEWLEPARTFAGLRCPHCDATAPLVASKTRLGCQACLAGGATNNHADTTSRSPTPTQTKTDATVRAGPADPAPATAVASADVPAATSAPAATRAPQPDAPASASKAQHRPTPVPPAAKQRQSGKRSQRRSAKTAARSSNKSTPPETGDKLVTSFWEQVAAQDRRLPRYYAPQTPASTLHRLYGKAGPLYVVGCHGFRPTAIRAGISKPAEADPDRFVVNGELETNMGRHDFGICWRLYDGNPLIDEISPRSFHRWPVDNPFGPTWDDADAQAPDPGPALDAVGRLFWERGLPLRGLTMVLRMLTAWARVDDAEQLRHQHPRAVLAAAVDRLVSYRCRSHGSGYADVAALYRVDAAAVRAVNDTLQRRLKLSSTRVW
jgi:hypothetical protein